MLGFLIDTTLAAMLEMAVQNPLEAAWSQAQRSERIIRILQKVGLDPQRPPDVAFETLYTYALVEWGATKPPALLQIFRDEQVRAAFERSWHTDDPLVWEDEVQTVATRLRDSGQYPLDYDPRRELNRFKNVFDRLVTFTRTPHAARQDRTLDELRQGIGELLARLETLAPAADDKTLLQPYLEMVARQSNYLSLAPLDPSGQDAAQMQLGHVYVPLNAGAVQLPDDAARLVTSALGHVYYQRQLILLGDPGSGKSTLLRFLALCLAQLALTQDDAWRERLSWPAFEARSDLPLTAGRGRRSAENSERRRWEAAPALPIWIEWRDFVRTPFDPHATTALWSYVERRLEREKLAAALPALQRAALNGRVIFLLDGVDEVSLEQRAAVWQVTGALERGAFGGNRWVATCRRLSFEEKSAPSVPNRLLQPLDEEQIETFIRHWFGRATEIGLFNQEEAARKIHRLQAAVRRETLRPLAQNPMLLTIMAIVQSFHGSLPEQRAKLYQACVETLLLRWQLSKELPDVLGQLDTTQETLERLLWEIGYTAHSRSPEGEAGVDLAELEVIEVARRHLGSYAKAEAFVQYTEQRAHLLIGRGGTTGNLYGFPHRTFQEYLAACHVAAQRRFGQRARELAETGDVWREALNLAVGALAFNQNNREKALDGVKVVLPETTPAAGEAQAWRRVWLAGEMLATVGREAAESDEVGRELLPPVRARLAALLSGGQLTARQRAAAGVALGQLGDARPAVMQADRMGLCWIPAGPFVMGSDDEALRVKYEELGEDVPPSRHENNVPYGYWMGQFPVTNAQFQQFVADGGYARADLWPEAAAQGLWRDNHFYGWYWTGQEWEKDVPHAGAHDYSEPFNLDNHPVVGVSWYEALAFCRWLTARWRAAGWLPEGWAVQLPSEAEWEKAARGGRETPLRPIERAANDGLAAPPTPEAQANADRAYAWGDDFDAERANIDDTGIGATTAVGVFPAGAGPYGCQEMNGNVWEWTRSLWGHYDAQKGQFEAIFHYPYTPTAERERLDADIWHLRVIRGGSWGHDSTWARCAFRHGNDPGYWGDDFGFRVVVSPFIFTSAL